MADNHNEEMDGVESTFDDHDLPLLTADEKRVLDLYDRLEELQFEIEFLKVRGVLSQGEVTSGDGSKEETELAEEELLKAKARYQVRHNIIESVLVANPNLQAVHSGNTASVVEHDLLPLVQKRDTLSISLSELSSKMQSARKDLEKVELENIAVTRENAELSTKMLALAEEADTRRKEDIKDPEVRSQLEELELEMKTSRQRFRIMKGTASATIVGSGVDWARDPELLKIVLDEDGDDE